MYRFEESSLANNNNKNKNHIFISILYEFSFIVEISIVISEYDLLFNN